MPAIIRICEWPVAAIAELLAESEQEGFRFVRRAQDDWRSGANRFANEGEALFGVFEGERLVAIGGINRESGSCGRLRRFYVRRDGRRKGMGRQLVQHVLAFARRHYSRVELRCDTAAADRFYRALGFSRTSAAADVTHAMELEGMMVLASATVIGFIPTKDFRRAKKFYASKLGLSFLAQDEFALVFESGGTAIRVVKVGEFKAASFTILGWWVTDIEECVRKLRRRRIVFERYAWMKQDDLGIWTAPGGTKVAWFKDPDGNVLSLSSR